MNTFIIRCSVEFKINTSLSPKLLKDVYLKNQLVQISSGWFKNIKGIIVKIDSIKLSRDLNHDCKRID